MQKILGCPAHMIVLSRAKTEWAMEEKNGKSVPTKVGLGSEGDKQMDYEYTVSFMIQQGTHIASVDDGGKDNTGLFDGKYEVITEDTGRKLYAWANSGAQPANTRISTESATPSEDELPNIKKEIISLCGTLGGTKNTELMNTLKKYVSSGNPNAIDTVDKAKECLEAVKNVKPLA